MKIKLFAFAVAAMFFASCSDDDVEVVVDTTNLTHTWYNSYYTVNGETVPHDNENCDGTIKYDYVEFTEAENIYRMVESIDCEDVTTEGTFTLNGREITVNAGGTAESMTIRELTEDKFVVERFYDFDGDGQEDRVLEGYAKNQ